MQASLNKISKEDELFSNTYLKALISNENKRKQRKIRERGRVRLRCELNTPQVKLFIGNIRRKNPNKDPSRSP